MPDGIKVEVYGTVMPLNQTANDCTRASCYRLRRLTRPILQLLHTRYSQRPSAWLNPSDDGSHSASAPALTEERRKFIVSPRFSEKVEDAHRFAPGSPRCAVRQQTPKDDKTLLLLLDEDDVKAGRKLP